MPKEVELAVKPAASSIEVDSRAGATVALTVQEPVRETPVVSAAEAVAVACSSAAA